MDDDPRWKRSTPAVIISAIVFLLTVPNYLYVTTHKQTASASAAAELGALTAALVLGPGLAGGIRLGYRWFSHHRYKLWERAFVSGWTFTGAAIMMLIAAAGNASKPQ